MLMNVHPRAVSHGSFRTSVPRDRVEYSYQTHLDMPSEGNSWGVLGPVGSTTPGNENWDCGIGNIQEDDKFSFSPDAYTGCFETNSPYGLAPGPSQVRVPAHNLVARRNQFQYNLQQLSSSCFDNQVPTMGGNNQNWVSQDIMTTAPEYSRLLSTNEFLCRTPGNPEGRSLMSFSSSMNTMSALSGLAMMDSPTGRESLDSEQTSPSMTYSTSFTSGLVTSDPMAVSFDSLAVHDNYMGNTWWEDILEENAQPIYRNALPFSNNGLPNQMVTSVPSSIDATSDWSLPAGTVSPHSLTLNPHSTSMMSSGAGENYTMSGTNSRNLRSVTVAPVMSEHARVTPAESQDRGSRPSRHKLPSKPTTRPHVPILPSSNRRVAKSEKKQILATSSTSQTISVANSSSSESNRLTTKALSKTLNTSRKLIPKNQDNLTDAKSSSVREDAERQQEKNKTSKLDPRLAETSILQTTANRDDMDQFLVKSKLSGMSYKEIRSKGAFTEAESTLRGRFRTLTKKKDERVRRPEWDDNDVRLLKKAVRKLSHGSDPVKMKTPWKQVADYIFDHGGSYHFGNATCRKRWDLLQEKRS